MTLAGVTVMLSGPTDTADDIALVASVIQDWNTQHARDQRLVFLPVHYSRNVVPVYAAGVDGQAVINQQITNDSDVVMCLFRHRLGTPTPRSDDSGSVEEVEIGSTNGHAHVWFWNGNIPRSVLTDGNAKRENERLEAFRRTFESPATPKGLYGTFESDEQLRALVEQTLWMHVRGLKQVGPSATGSPAAKTVPSVDVTLVGPVWHLSDVQKIITAATTANANARGLGESTTSRYVQESLDRADELDAALAANVGVPLAVEVSTDGARITDLRIEITVTNARGMDPEHEAWHDVWKTPSAPSPFGFPASMVGSYTLPRLRSVHWPERSSWEQDDADVIVTVEIDDLRKKRSATRVGDDVVIALESGSATGDGTEKVHYVWEASGDVSGQTESWSGEGTLVVIGSDDALSRLKLWGEGALRADG